LFVITAHAHPVEVYVILAREHLTEKYHCTFDLLFDQFRNVYLYSAKFNAPSTEAISKPVKQEVNCTVIPPPKVFPGLPKV